jgi:hypothetical protein
MIKLFWKPGQLLASLALLSVSVLVSPAQTIIQTFPGLTLTDVNGLGASGSPPDTMGAAGTNQFVVFINGGFAIYTKAGVRQSFVTDVAFWTNAGISSATISSAGLTDPRIIYDTASGRWFASEITANNTGNKVLVGRSNSSDPAAGWKALFFTGNTGFADYDTLGVDSTGVYIGVQDFSSSVGGSTGVSFFSIPKTDLLAATPTLANMTKFENLSTGSYGTTLQSVVNPDAGLGHGLFISIDDALNFFDRYTINGSGAAGATLGTRVRISNTYDGSPNPATPPSGQTVDALDDRFSGAVKQIGRYVFMANTILQGSKDAVHWIVLNETNNVILGEGIISDANFDFFQPSIAASHNGKFLMAFNRCGANSGASNNISIYAAAGTFTNSTVTMGAPFLLKQGTTGSFSISFDSQPYRWGDYSATMIDPTDDDLFWTIQEIPASSTSWGTQITLISMATNRPSLNLTRTNTTVKLSWPLSTDPAFLLQSTTNLATAVWATVTNTPVISLNQNIVTLTLTNKVAFFRLKK